MNKTHRSYRLLRGAILVSTCLAVSACNGRLNDFDTASGASKKDYESLLGRRGQDTAKKAEVEPPIPQFQSVLAAPSAPELADIRRVSISVTETTQVRDILIELARKADVDLEMDQRISGGIIMTATDRPFIDVIERICDLAELRFKFTKNTLSVEVDAPYMEQYHLGVLNIARSMTSEVSSSTDASSASQAIGASGGGGGSNKSSSSVSATSTADFWQSIGTNIRNIIAGIQRRQTTVVASQAAYTPQAAAAKAAAPAAAPAPAPGAPNLGQAGQALNSARGLAARQDQVSAVLAEEPQANLGPAASPRSVSGGGGPTGDSEFSINSEAGIITVFATQRQHKAIDRYLREVLNSVNQQVLIEAKIIEVQLDDQYSAGINWAAALGPDSEKLNITTNFSRDVVPPEFSNPTFTGSWNLARGIAGCATSLTNPQGLCSRDLTAAVQLVKQFGTVRTLSSPRITVTNNQLAMLKVAKNQVFFQLTATVTDATATSPSKTNVNSQIKTVPVGIILSVQPAVDPVTRRISLSLRPSITRITSFIQDPGVQVTLASANQGNNSAINVSSPIPIIETREMDSMLNLDSGDTIVMGGLMQDNSTNIREGLPGAMDIPILGQALSETVKRNSVSELVIFIRATIVNPRNTIADEDIRLYKTFTPDPRPVAF